ncbi:MAG: hypothetical protein UW64_C0016G0006 [Microgenomates group bacterium GW2011_GWC1_44_37]|uniref:Uncharacterized protein n=1 Tax=Candidatus Collierbacteria bacterium GW2011_GWB2_44_22 TaxID=1618387 RepID=A0A0G1HWN5_9BACT|nr:MAG: hypothetical protein UW31_C0006G0064 [Candidatus Collierbacteria bacterium GW2011_GWA2_44_13]KKT50042.1 MAG: hypothetical protein UW42_C0025G0004 [Candidatus Collierbacteria bacterium GW2011_GWB1_44_197]KKT51345.1 MAG: hypothetical protein UW44_C0013G0065 [Candidatus Collierbacteria bacterium GW2011_GWB2_44_22]KKT61477.1 MAG: hypothetical protein UW56_C0025G0014 [Candidatus Collierbacteria bacterium GW2011_GWD1_44_27]KKT65634.1 MAG: hypothetical protein UW58_C0024G0013 [Candidatus Colli
MTPEEEFNQEVWTILQKITREQLATENNKPVEFMFPHVQGVGIIPEGRQKKILYKLQELGVLRVRENPWEPPESSPYIFYLDIIQPYYGEIYEKFNKACEIGEHLNQYQQSLMKGTETPTFSQIGKGMDTIVTNIRNEILKWKDLKLDKERQTIQYGEKPIVEVSFGINHIKLLVLLLESNGNKVIEYREIAKILNPDSSLEKIKNNDVSRDVQSIKRDLVTYLKDVMKMDKETIDMLIVSKNKVGYKLGTG